MNALLLTVNNYSARWLSRIDLILSITFSRNTSYKLTISIRVILKPLKPANTGVDTLLLPIYVTLFCYRVGCRFGGNANPHDLPYLAAF